MALGLSSKCGYARQHQQAPWFVFCPGVTQSVFFFTLLFQQCDTQETQLCYINNPQSFTTYKHHGSILFPN